MPLNSEIETRLFFPKSMCFSCSNELGALVDVSSFEEFLDCALLDLGLDLVDAFDSGSFGF